MSIFDHVHDKTFHSGETYLQEKVGLAERMADLGPKVIRKFMPAQHRVFFEHLTYVVIGGLDQNNQPWASILYGAQGFIRSPSETVLRINALPLSGDPLFGQLVPGTALGLLGFEAHTRRRNRANGTVVHVDAHGFDVHIMESFGNCPKYIQAREASLVTSDQSGGLITCASRLNDELHAFIGKADTFFIASAHPQAGEGGTYGVDISHRGGKPGFVSVSATEDGHDRLVVPDFVGNFFFNTLGNIALNPHVGLLFVDYEKHDVVHIAGDAELILDGPLIDAYVGAERLFTVTIRSVVQRRACLPLDWGQVEPSPFLEHTGHW